MSEKKYELLREVMDYSKQRIDKFCTDWAMKGVIRSENQIRFSDSQIDINKNWDEIKLIIFLSMKRRTTEISISDLTQKSIETSLNYCEKLLNSAKININYKRLPEGPFKYDKGVQDVIYDEKVSKLGEKAIDLVENSVEAAKNQGAKRTAGSFFFGNENFYQENSMGLEGKYKRTNLNLRIRAFAEDMYATGESITCSTHLEKGFNAHEAGVEAGTVCKQAIGGKKGKPGTYNIIIYPKVCTELQAPTFSIAMRSYVKKMGLSWLIGKSSGTKIAHDVISAWDDGTVAHGLNSSPFDDELVPRKKSLLLDKGIVNQYFTNTSQSKKNEESTGNAGITMPKPTNTVFAPGDHALEELMEISDKPTLLITSTWYTRYQSYAPPGVLSSLPKDGMFLVKNRGKELEPVRELRINSNHFHMLENTIALGKEVKQVLTWLSPSNNPIIAPYMLIEDIKMTTGTK